MNDIDPVELALEHIRSSENSKPRLTSIVEASLAIQSSGVQLPFGREKITAFRVAQTAHDIDDLADAYPGDFND